MRKSIFFIALTTLLSIGRASAGDLDRAFKYINTGDYDKALQNIREELTDDPKNAAANFAMAKLFSSHDFKKFNLDSATIYINKASAAIPLNPDDKQTKKYLKLGVRDFTIKALADDINKEAYDKAKAVNSFESYDHFIKYSRDEALTVKATEKRDEIKYDELKVREDIVQLKEFLNNYPKSKNFAEANELYEKLLYQQITKPDSYQSYKEYIDKYPTGPYVKEAQTKYELKLYESYLKKNKLDEYIEFEKNYPKSPHLGDVQDSIYAQSTKDQKPSDYNYFIKTFPSNKNIIEAWNRLYELYTIDAKDSEYAYFEKTYPGYPVHERLLQDKFLAALNLAPYKTDEKYGYVNTAIQTIVIQPQYYDANEFHDGLAAVAIRPCTDSCLYSYIDKAGKVIIAKNFSSGGDFIRGRAVVATAFCDGEPCEFGIINRRGEFVVSPVYDDMQPASEGLYAARTSRGYGFIDGSGTVIIPFRYQDATSFSEGAAAVERDSSWLFIDHSGAQIFMKVFKNVSPFSSGLAAVTDDDSVYAYIDRSGEWAIQPAYEFAEPFIGDTAIVTIKEANKKNKNYGISFRYKIDKSGKNCYKLVNPNAATAQNAGNKKRKKK